MVTLVNRAKMTIVSTGTGTLTLGTAVDGFQDFGAAGVADGDLVRYVIEEGTAWEIGTGIYAAAGPSLTRSPSESSAGGARIPLSGAAVVFITATTADIIQPGDNITKLTNDAGYTANPGTVTSVAAAAGAGISVSGAPITSAGTLTITNTAPHQPTNLGLTGTGNSRTLTSSTGSNVTLPVATPTNAGLMATGDKTKLDGISAGAQVNVATDLGIIGSGDSRTLTSSTGSNVTLPVVTPTNAGLMATGDKSKLDGIAAGAQVNIVTSVAGQTGAVTLVKGDVGLGDVDNTSDADKPISTATQTALSSKVDTTDNRLTNSREWTASTISQSEAEAGTAIARRAFTAQRVRQAILGWWNGSSDKAKLDGIETGAQANAATNLGITGTGNTRTITSSTGSNVTIPVASTTTAGWLSTADKTKLDGIQAGAQVNVATNLGSSGTGATRTLTSSTGSNTTITYSPADIGAAASTHAHADATTTVSGFMSGADKAKLNGIAAGAQVNIPTNLSVTSGTTAGPSINSSTGNTIILPTASGTVSGVVTTGAQSFAGVKTFLSTITGSISGNAGTATTLQTARSINGTSFNGSAAITTANWGTARTLTIGSSGKSVNGSGNVSWSLAEIGAAAANATVNLTGDQAISGIKTFTGILRAQGTNVDSDGVTRTGRFDLQPAVAEGSTRQAVLTTEPLTTTRTYTFPNASGNVILSSGTQTVGGLKTFSTAIAISGTSKAAGRLYAGTTNPSNTTRLNYDGNLHVNALTAVGDVTAFSDARLKAELERIPDALAKVSRLTGYTYTRKDTGARQTGVIAQDVQQVLPEAVIDCGDHLALAYGNMVGLLIEAIKELKTEIEELKHGPS